MKGNEGKSRDGNEGKRTELRRKMKVKFREEKGGREMKGRVPGGRLLRVSVSICQAGK